MKKRFLSFIFLAAEYFIFSQDLLIDKDDVSVIQDPEGGYHLYVRAKDDIKSVMLTETTKDPDLKLDNYAYRAKTYNTVNGDERRILNNEFLNPEKKIYSLIDSSPEKDTPLGDAYHIWIPYVIEYGYDWGRNGEIEVADGTFFNIRAFAKPYGDYSGEFKDNPFALRLTQKPVEPSSDALYSKDAVEAFSSLAKETSGIMMYSKTPDEILPTIKNILKKDKNDSLDVLFALDATESMKDDIEAVRQGISSVLSETMQQYKSYRISLILYKDYKEDFLVKEACVFTDNLKKFEKALYGFKVFGGRDIPEAVYEGLYLGLKQLWRTSDKNVDRKLILIGDAPPHSRPRGKVSKKDIDKLAQEKNVSIYSIILPHTLAY